MGLIFKLLDFFLQTKSPSRKKLHVHLVLHLSLLSEARQAPSRAAHWGQGGHGRVAPEKGHGKDIVLLTFKVIL